MLLGHSVTCQNMKYLIQLTAFTFLTFVPLYANVTSGNSLEAWVGWFGNYHFIFLHFPIALIIMACVAEVLLTVRKDPQYNFIVNFLLIAAAILVVPTVLAGLSLAHSGPVTEETNPLLEWHQIFGFLTLTLTCITVIIRNWLGRHALYLWCLFALLICVTVTSHLGSIMAFGEFNLLPPFFTRV